MLHYQGRLLQALSERVRTTVWCVCVCVCICVCVCVVRVCLVRARMCVCVCGVRFSQGCVLYILCGHTTPNGGEPKAQRREIEEKGSEKGNPFLGMARRTLSGSSMDIACRSVLECLPSYYEPVLQNLKLDYLWFVVMNFISPQVCVTMEGYCKISLGKMFFFCF